MLKTAAEREGGGDRGPEKETGTAGKGAGIDCTLIHLAKVSLLQKETVKIEKRFFCVETSVTISLSSCFSQQASLTSLASGIWLQHTDQTNAWSLRCMWCGVNLPGTDVTELNGKGAYNESI